MKSLWKSLKRFWLAEEIPRWIGVGLVLVYISGLLGVASFSIDYAEQRAMTELRRSTEHSVAMLAQMATVSMESPSFTDQHLRPFAARNRCVNLRYVDGNGVIKASLDAEEVGLPASKALPDEAASVRHAWGESWTFAAPDGSARWMIHALVPGTNLTPDPTDTQPLPAAQGYVEAVMSGLQPEGVWEGKHLWTLLVIAGSSALFLLLYHRLRLHLRAVSHIADHLLALKELDSAVLLSPMGDRDSPSPNDSHPASVKKELDGDLTRLRISDSLGEVASAWNQMIEITEELRLSVLRSTASSELQKVLERSGGGELADALQVVPEGIILLSSDRRISYINALGLGLLGCTEERASGGRLPDVAEGLIGQKIAHVVESAGNAGQNCFSAITELLTDQTDSSSYRVRVVPLNHVPRGMGCCVVLISDVSQQVRADRAREEFVSQVTHELRTPLTNIRAYTETLSSGMFDDPQVVTECYNVITKETRRLSRLIEDILSVSQLEVGSMELVVDDVDIKALLTDSVRDLRGIAEEKRIDLQLTLPAKLPTFLGDRDKLLVVVTNLVGNAVKYTPAGGEVRVGCQVNGLELLMTVKDSGIGIDPADHERIFEKFQRSRDPLVQAETGTGIGLTTAREIVYRHGGTVEVISTKGKGATFIVHLPLSGAPQGVNLGVGGHRFPNQLKEDEKTALRDAVGVSASLKENPALSANPAIPLSESPKTETR